MSQHQIMIKPFRHEGFLLCFLLTVLLLAHLEPCLTINIGKLTNKQQQYFPITTKDYHFVRNRPILYLVGDSITQFSSGPNGFQHLFLSWYGNNLDIINRGFSGWNTDILVNAFETDFEQTFYSQPTDWKQPVLVIFTMGANDACFADSPSKQHVPLERYSDNIKQMISIMKKKMPSSTIDILLTTPPPMNATQFNQTVGPPGGFRDNKHTAMYAQAVREIFASERNDERGVYLCDLWTDMHEWTTGHPFVDGLHMSAVGNQIMFNHMQKVIKEKIPHFDGDKMDSPFTNWWEALKELHNFTRISN